MQMTRLERFMNMYVFQIKYISMLQKVPSTNEAKNKTPKQQRLGSNHNSGYDTAEAGGEVCTTQSWN